MKYVDVGRRRGVAQRECCAAKSSHNLCQLHVLVVAGSFPVQNFLKMSNWYCRKNIDIGAAPMCRAVLPTVNLVVPGVTVQISCQAFWARLSS